MIAMTSAPPAIALRRSSCAPIKSVATSSVANGVKYAGTATFCTEISAMKTAKQASGAPNGNRRRLARHAYAASMKAIVTALSPRS
jgi:hypothetical protein